MKSLKNLNSVLIFSVTNICDLTCQFVTLNIEITKVCELIKLEWEG